MSFIGSFSSIMHQFEHSNDRKKKEEALNSIQGLWEKFSKLTGFTPPPISKSPLTRQNPTATKPKTNMTDDEGFIHPAIF